MPHEVLIVVPGLKLARGGNNVTAERWQDFLGQDRQLDCKIRKRLGNASPDLLLAIHARHCAQAVIDFKTGHPDRPAILLMAGTDLYRDLPKVLRRAKSRGSDGMRSPILRAMHLADRLIVLQPDAIRHLPKSLRSKAVSILQSVHFGERKTLGERKTAAIPKPKGEFKVCCAGHLRPVKDPMRIVMASRLLPEKSKVKVYHFGKALREDYARRAKNESKVSRRYQWFGSVPRPDVLAHLRSSDLFVLTSKLEGGANAISEAIVCRVPVLSSRISGSIGILGREYPGYFDVGDSEGLADLLWRAESEPRFYASLVKGCDKIRPLLSEQREGDTLRRLVRACLEGRQP